MDQLSDRIGDDHFTNRERELALLTGTLEDTARPVPMIHLFGVGGIGKTVLMRRFFNEIPT